MNEAYSVNLYLKMYAVVLDNLIFLFFPFPNCLGHSEITSPTERSDEESLRHRSLHYNHLLHALWCPRLCRFWEQSTRQFSHWLRIL